jgi:hypothetical protein
MEVHHHGHVHEKKKWKEYLFQFFMLFLAVFCGFLAEYQLEHKIEKDRGKQYVASLIKDLEYDTLQFGNAIQLIEKELHYYASILHFFKNTSMYNYSLPFRFYIETNLEESYTPSRPAIEQLKGSGNLRLFHNQLALDSILKYDSYLTGPYKNQTQYTIEATKRLIHSLEPIFDLTNFNRFVDDVMKNSSAHDVSAYDTPFTAKNQDAIRQVQNIYISTKAADFFYLQTLEETKNLAVNLLRFLTEEYNVE